MFSDRNGAKTTPFGVVCAHTCISLYKRGPAPPQAKKPLVIARLLSSLPPPPQRKKKEREREKKQPTTITTSAVGDNYLLLRPASLHDL